MDTITKDNTSSDGSSVSLDTSEMMPLSPRTVDLDRVDQATASGVRGQFVMDDREQRQMASADLPRSRKDGSLLKKFFSVGVVVIILISLVLIVSISYNMKKIQCHEDREKHIMEMYKGLFMTKEEMQEQMAGMEARHEPGKFAPVVARSRMPQYNCTLNKSAISAFANQPRLAASMSRDGITIHACCETRVIPLIYESLDDTVGAKRKIIQFRNRHQYFYVEQCNHTMHCPMPCTCTQQMRSATALISDDDLSNPRLTTVMYLGSCKCINARHH